MKIFILFLIVTSVESYKILCLFPYPGKSHYMVFEPILDELINRGHHLTVVSFFPATIPLPNRRDVSLQHLAPPNVEVLDLKEIYLKTQKYFGLENYFGHMSIVTSLAKSNLLICERIINSDVFEEFLAGKGEYDLILIEHFNSDCLLSLVHIYNVPSIGLISSSMMPWTMARAGAPDNPAYIPGMTLPFTEKMTFFERLINTFTLHFYNTWFEYAIWREEQKIIEKKLKRKLPRLSDLGKNSSAVLVNTHFSINGIRELTPSLIEIGGIHLHNRTIRELNEPLRTLVENAEEGFIIFSFGSLVKGSSLPRKQMKAIINAFARLPQTIFWKWEDDISDAIKIPKNVKFEKWLPQYDLLNQQNCLAFITHGGLLSLTEAVASSVPTLIIPILGDQFGNAAHAQKAGVAEVLSLTEIEEDVFYNKLLSVLSKEKRQKAKLLTSLWRDRPQPAMETALFNIELVARHKGLDMSSGSRWLSPIQYLLLDIIAFIVFVLFISTFTFVFILKTFISVVQIYYRNKEKSS